MAYFEPIIAVRGKLEISLREEFDFSQDQNEVENENPWKSVFESWVYVNMQMCCRSISNGYILLLLRHKMFWQVQILAAPMNYKVVRIHTLHIYTIIHTPTNMLNFSRFFIYSSIHSESKKVRVISKICEFRNPRNPAFRIMFSASDIICVVSGPCVDRHFMKHLKKRGSACLIYEAAGRTNILGKKALVTIGDTEDTRRAAGWSQKKQNPLCRSRMINPSLPSFPFLSPLASLLLPGFP